MAFAACGWPLSAKVICLAVGALVATLATNNFTLAWTHSIEKVRWEEDWQATSEGLKITEARIRGTGAGMEIPPDAVLKNGVWHYVPSMSVVHNLRLAHSEFAPEYELCMGKPGALKCHTLSNSLRGIDNNGVIEIRHCEP